MIAQDVNLVNTADARLESHRAMAPDVLKALAIFAVVFIHGSSIIPYVRSVQVDRVSAFLRCCVPLFILLWAFFMEKALSKRDNSMTYISNRLLKLLVPFFFWSTVYFVMIADFSNLTPTKVFTKHWFGRGWSGQYYFIILFQLIPCFIILRNLTLRYIKFLPVTLLLSLLFYIVIAYSSLFTISIIDKIGDELFVYWIPYVVIGVLYANRNLANTVGVPLVWGCVGLLLVPVEFYFLHPRTQPYLTPAVFVSSVLIFASVMHSRLSWLNADSPFSRFIQLVAKNTLGIFCLNPLVILCIIPFTQTGQILVDFRGCAVIMPILSTLLIILLCLIIIYALKRLKLSALVAN